MNKKPPVQLNDSQEPNSNSMDGVVEVRAQEWPQQEIAVSKDHVAEEVAVALVYNGVSHVVMMVTPLNLEAFALGFSLTEGIVEAVEDIFEIRIERLEAGIEVSITVSSQCFAKLKDRRRNLAGRTGCGLCGAESLQQVRRNVSPVVVDFQLSHEAVNRSVRALDDHQPLQKLTGALHVAAWCDLQGNLVEVCEDVGRHNAVDKLVGLLKGGSTEQLEGYVLVSSRASYEILQKSAVVNIGMVVAISAPTSLAIEIAEEMGITLIGFAREGRHIAYTHSHRLISQN